MLDFNIRSIDMSKVVQQIDVELVVDTRIQLDDTRLPTINT